MIQAMRARSVYKKATVITAAFVLAVSSLTASVPFILSSRAGAVSGYNYSNISLNTADWKQDRTAPSGGYTIDATTGRVLVSINQKKSSTIDHHKTEGVTTSVPTGTTSLRGSFFIPADWSTKNSVRVGLWGVTNTPVSWPIIEYAVNVGGYSGWRIWNTVDGGWTNLSTPVLSNRSNNVEVALNAAQSKFTFYVNGAVVGSFPSNGAQTFTDVILNSYNAGTGNAVDNYVVDWRNLTAGQAPATSACVPTVVWSNNLNVWKTTGTGTSGSSEVAADGILVTTTGTTSQSKATGYLDVNYPLVANGSQTIAQSMEWIKESGGANANPGLQLGVDFNNDGTEDGILVGEAVYGNDWWLTNGSQLFVKDNAPRTSGGFGSAYHGTLNEWLAVYPTAQVKRVGYSLGSGVEGRGVIKSMTFNCTTYKFDNVGPATAPQPYNPSNGGLNNQANATFVWRNDAPDASSYEVRLSSSAGRTPNQNDGELSGSDARNVIAPKAAGDFSQVTLTSPLTDGYWFWQVRAIDQAGNAGKWSNIWSTEINAVAPASPTNLQWVTSANTVVTNDGGTHRQNGTAVWTGSTSTDVDRYVYKYWNDIAGNPYKVGNEYITVVYGTNVPGTFNQGEGKHYISVTAVDVAGNESAPTVISVDYSTRVVSTIEPIVSNDATPTIAGQYQWAADNEGIDGQSLTVEVNGKAYAVATTSTGQWSTTIPEADALENGTYAVIVRDITNTEVGTAQFVVNVDETGSEEPGPGGNTGGGTPVTQPPVTGGPAAPADNEGGETVAAPDTTTQLANGGLPLANFGVIGQQVLGDSTTTAPSNNADDQGSPAVEGASTQSTAAQAVDSDANQGRFMGMSWYWWLLILAGVALIGWWIAAAIRRRRAES